MLLLDLTTGRREASLQSLPSTMSTELHASRGTPLVFFMDEENLHRCCVRDGNSALHTQPMLFFPQYQSKNTFFIEEININLTA